MLRLGAQALETIRAEGEGAYPDECCGALIGTAGQEPVGDGPAALRAFPMRNLREPGERYHRFIADPVDMLAAERSADAEGLDVIGYYHSHPDVAAVPSQYDVDVAVPFYLSLILSVGKGKAGEIRCWRYVVGAGGLGAYEEEAVELCDSR